MLSYLAYLVALVENLLEILAIQGKVEEQKHQAVVLHSDWLLVEYCWPEHLLVQQQLESGLVADPLQLLVLAIDKLKQHSQVMDKQSQNTGYVKFQIWKTLI